MSPPPSVATTDGTRSVPRLWIFGLWLLIFYAAWLSVLCLVEGSCALALEHWPMAAAMSAGSYFAGSTPMGGGTVGFPVLVLLFGLPASLGRDFSFAVQAIGMTSAAIYIYAAGQPLAKRMLGSAVVGACVGTPLGLTFIAPVIPGPLAKLLFAIVWASFGILTLQRVDELARQEGVLVDSLKVERVTGFLTGLLGSALVASITGVGVDMIIYVVLVLARRADSRVGIPTSVVLMAITSIIGVFWQTLVTGDVHPDVFGNWLAAAPVVAIGAPFGALIVTRLGRKPTLLVVAVLCLGQFAWTLSQEYDRLGLVGIGLVLGGLFIVQRLFAELSRWGARLAGAHEESMRPGEVGVAAETP